MHGHTSRLPCVTSNDRVKMILSVLTVGKHLFIFSPTQFLHLAEADFVPFFVAPMINLLDIVWESLNIPES